MKNLIALAALSLGTSVAAAPNLVVNGDFEAAPAPAGAYSQYGGGNGFTGWTATGNDILVIDKAYAEGSLVFNANDGSSNAVDLTGAGNTGPADGITQTVATIGGKRYQLSFFVGNASPSGQNAGSYTQPSTLNLSIDGGAIMTFTNAVNVANGIDFAQFTTFFTATGPTLLAFSNGTVGDNYLGLDNVSVSLVPEPATWGLMIAGFAMVGAVTRRRSALTA